MDILSEIESVKADNVAAQSLLEEAKASTEALAAQLADKDSALASVNGTLEAKIAEVDSLIASLDAKEKAIADLQKALAAMAEKEKTAQAKAVEMVANVGIKPIAVDYATAAAAQSKESFLATYGAFTNARERSQFYYANRAALFGSK